MLILKQPTISTLIDYLSKFPPDTKIFIEDPDTGWTIDVFHCRGDEYGVWLTGEYREMVNK